MIGGVTQCWELIPEIAFTGSSNLKIEWNCVGNPPLGKATPPMSHPP